MIEGHEGKALKLYVYNLDDDRCREVSITPNGAWGGEGRYVTPEVGPSLVIYSFLSSEY